MADIATLAPGRSRFGLSLPLLFGLLVYAMAVSAGGSALGDPDTYWHIAVGRWIIAHRAVPYHDVFSFSMPDASFTPPEWLAEVAMAWLYDHFGWTGLVAATALSVAAALAMLLRVLLRTLAPVHALIATVLTWAVVMPHIFARPHIFVLPMLVAWVTALVAARAEDRAPSPWLALLITLWANLHSSYIFGIVLAALLAGEAILLASDRRARLRALGGWGLFGVLSVGAALITPFGIDGLLQPFRLAQMHDAFVWLVEWQSPNFQRYHPLELWIMVVLFAALSLGWRLPLTRAAMLLLMLHMALEHQRYVEQLGFVAPLLVAPALGAQLKERLGGRAVLPLDRRMAELAKPASARGIALAGAILLAVSAAALHGDAVRERNNITPAAALAAVEGRHTEGPVFNDYRFGGYLILRGIKPFIDGRYSYGDPFIRRYFEVTAASRDQLPALLDEYGITWTLLYSQTPAVVLLDHLPGWRRFYTDDIAVVHVREAPLGR
jgi:hypothetical protein